MYTRPTNFPFGDLFTYKNCLDNIDYIKDTKFIMCSGDVTKDMNVVKDQSPPLPCCVFIKSEGRTETAIANLSNKKIFYIKETPKGVIVKESEFEGAKPEVWVPLYRTKGCEATGISMVCTFFGTALIPFSIVYNALRVVAIPFVLLYRIGKVAIDIIRRKPDDVQTKSQIAWKHFVEFADHVVSSIYTILDNLFWRVVSVLGHVVGVLEGLFINPNQRLGRRIVAYAECMANRTVSLLKTYRSPEFIEGTDLSKGRSLFYGCWSVIGFMNRFDLLSWYHAFFLAGCYQPIAIGVLDAKGEKVEFVRNDSGKKISNATNYQEKGWNRQKGFDPCPCC